MSWVGLSFGCVCCGFIEVQTDRLVLSCRIWMGFSKKNTVIIIIMLASGLGKLFL